MSASASYPGTEAPQDFAFTFTVPAAPGKQTQISLTTDAGADWEVVIMPESLSFSVVRKTAIHISPVSVSLKVQIKPKQRSDGPVTVTASASNMTPDSMAATSP